MTVASNGNDPEQAGPSEIDVSLVGTRGICTPSSQIGPRDDRRGVVSFVATTEISKRAAARRAKTLAVEILEQAQFVDEHDRVRHEFRRLVERLRAGGG